MNDQDTLLTAREIAQYLGITQRAFRRWVAAGRFPAPIRNGRCWARWRVATIRAYLDQLQTAASR